MHVQLIITFRLIFIRMTSTACDIRVYLHQSIKTRSLQNQINIFLTDTSTRQICATTSGFSTSNYTCTEFRLFTQCAHHNCHQYNEGKTKLEQHIGEMMKLFFFPLFYFLPLLFIFFLFFFLSFKCMANLQFELFKSCLVAKFRYDPRLTKLTENIVICDMS